MQNQNNNKLKEFDFKLGIILKIFGIFAFLSPIFWWFIKSSNAITWNVPGYTISLAVLVGFLFSYFIKNPKKKKLVGGSTKKIVLKNDVYNYDHYLPERLMEVGWSIISSKLIEEKPKFEVCYDHHVGFNLKIEAHNELCIDKGEDEDLRKRCKRVEFIYSNAESIEHCIHIKIKVRNKNDDEERDVWLTPSNNITKAKPGHIPRLSWMIPVEINNKSGKWKSVEIDLMNAFKETFAKYGDEYIKLVHTRLQRKICINKIILHTSDIKEYPYNEFILQRTLESKFIWDAEVTNINPKLLKSLSFKMKSEDDFWKAGIKFFSNYDHSKTFESQQSKPYFEFHLTKGSSQKGVFGVFLTIRTNKTLFIEEKKMPEIEYYIQSVQLYFSDQNKLKYKVNNMYDDEIDFDLKKFNAIIFPAWHETNYFKIHFKEISYTTK